MLRPAIHNAVQKALGSCCQRLGETAAEIRAGSSASAAQHSEAPSQAVKPGTFCQASHFQHNFIYLHPHMIQESHGYFNKLCEMLPQAHQAAGQVLGRNYIQRLSQKVKNLTEF